MTAVLSPMALNFDGINSFAFDFNTDGAVSTMVPTNMLQGTPSIADSEDIGDSKPSKKRRSWGQQLPTPTTNLPPRKRAKTEAEKEQRRIERVLRNRLAAHSSRERKRKEVELLEEEKSAIESHNTTLRDQLIRLTAENQKLKKKCKEYATELGREHELDVKDEESIPPTPPYSPAYNRLASPTATQPLTISTDMTQHPAVML